VPAPPARPRLRARYDGKQQAVVRAAARVFAERGYHGTSVQDLTEATGLAAGGLYHYIGSKDELLVLICNQLMEPLLAEAEQLLEAQGRPERQLRQLVEIWVAHVAAHRDHMLVFQQERHVIESEAQWRRLRRSRNRFEQMLEDVMRRCERESGIDFRDRDLALRALLGMVNHTATWFRPRGRLSPEAIANGYCDLLLGAAGRNAKVRSRSSVPVPARF
jgi:AcrR family transcriptional regulator